MAEAMTERIKAEGLPILGVEGAESAKWILIDCGDVVAHLFLDPVRPFYDLEGLWSDAPKIDLSKVIDAAASAAPAVEDFGDDDDFDDVADDDDFDDDDDETYD